MDTKAVFVMENYSNLLCALIKTYRDFCIMLELYGNYFALLT